MPNERRSHKRTVLYRAKEPGESEVYEVEYESVADALHFACRDLRTGRRRPMAILEEGEEVYDAAGIVEQCESAPGTDTVDAVRDRPAGEAAG